MNDEYRINDQYSRIGNMLLDTEEIFKDLREHPIRIEFLESDKPAPKSGRVVLGECFKVSDKVKKLMAASTVMENKIPGFFIVIYKERIKHFSPEQLRILIMHELMHIEVKKSDDGKATHSIRKHNVEEFDYILREYGLNWAGDFDGQITWKDLQEKKETKAADPEKTEVA